MVRQHTARRAGHAVLALLLAPVARAAPPSLDVCPPPPPALARHHQGQGLTTRHPPGQVAGFLEQLAGALAAQLPVPTGAAPSQLAPSRTPARRVRDLLETLIMIESHGLHRDRHGRLLASGAPGEPVGFLQVSAAAAAEAMTRWQALALRPPLPRDATPELRRDWRWNLRLGGLYLLTWVGEAPPGADPPGLPTLRALAAYVAGPAEPWVRAPPLDFQAALAERPELRRYVREANHLLELGFDDEAWRRALWDAATRRQGGWAEEARALRTLRHRTLPRCRRGEG